MRANEFPGADQVMAVDTDVMSSAGVQLLERSVVQEAIGRIPRPPVHPRKRKNDSSSDCTRMRRLLQLVNLMRSDQAFSADELAEKLGVSRRTVFRDVGMLIRSGIPCQFDGNRRGYRISRWHFLPPTGLDVSELLGLYIAAKKIVNSQSFPLFAEATRAIEKLAQNLPLGLWDACTRMANLVEIRWPAMVDTSVTSQIFHTLLSAAAEHRKVLLEYDSHAERLKARVVLYPYLLTLLDRAWYVIGYCEERQEIQKLGLDLVLSADLLKETFRVPSDFSLETYLGQAWTTAREGQVSSVRLRFSPEVCDRVEEIVWHKTQRTQRLPDGSLIFEVDVDGLTEISHWVLSFGDQVVVEEPVELRTRIEQMAHSILKRYA